MTGSVPPPRITPQPVDESDRALADRMAKGSAGFRIRLGKNGPVRDRVDTGNEAVKSGVGIVGAADEKLSDQRGERESKGGVLDDEGRYRPFVLLSHDIDPFDHAEVSL